MPNSFRTSFALSLALFQGITMTSAWVQLPLPSLTSSSSQLQATPERPEPGAISTRTAAEYQSRRGFLSQATVAMAAASPVPVWAEEKEQKEKLETQEKELVVEMAKDKVDEVKAEKETEELIAELEKTPNGSAAPDTSAEKATQKLIDQLEKDEEKVQAETKQLIEQVEKIEAQAESLKVNILPEPTAKTLEEAAQTSATETKQFVDALKERSANNEQLIDMLKGYKETVKDDPESKDELLEKLKARSKLTEDFLSQFSGFLERLSSRFPSKGS